MQQHCVLISDRPQETPMNSHDLAAYIEATDGLSQPWLLVQLRLKKLQERKASLSTEAYVQEMSDIYQDMMKLGEWWVGLEDQVFKSPPSEPD